MKKLIILLGASGSGKTTLEKKMFKLHSDKYDRVISATTRDMREGEKNGEDYHFKTKDEFKKMDLAESDYIDGSSYGTPVSELTKGNKDLILTMEPNGARKIIDYITNNKLNLDPKVVYFNISEERRMKNMKRRGDPIQKIKKRVQNDDIDQRFKRNNLKSDLEITELNDQLDILFLEKFYA